MAEVASLNLTDPHAPYAGWVSSSRDRGSIDILWSCCLTISLCCWVATHPNAGSSTDRWYHGVLDKFNLAMIGLLGPDFLFGIALGQLSSAMRSVRLFKQDKHLCNGANWTYTYAFFTDMGGIHLTSPDFERGFPITAEQLHYLVKHNHVDFPDMKQMNIGERNTTDTLSRFLTIWQVLWFSVTELQRIKQGLPMSTLELTAMSYVVVMVATQICWLQKPSIIKPRTISTKGGKTVGDIRVYAKQETHPDLLDNWYRTPLTFIDGNRFQIDTHWAYYIRLTESIRMPLASRQIIARPWDRFPSDSWMPCEMRLVPFGMVILCTFSASFVAAWNFFFPSLTEQLLWRIFSVYHAWFTIYGGVYYLTEVMRWHRGREILAQGSQVAVAARQPTVSATRVSSDPESLQIRADQRRKRRFAGTVLSMLHKLAACVASWRNISPDQDPTLALKLRIIIPITTMCALYVFSRTYFYLEDFISLRTQPVGVYITVNRYLPFLGDG